MIRAERFFIDILKLTHAAGDQNSLKPCLKTRQDIGAHIVANDHGIFGMAVDMVERRADNPRTGLAHIKGLFASNTLYRRTQGAAGWTVSGAVGVGIGGYKTGTAGDESRGLMDHIPVIGAGFTDNHEVGINVSNGKASLVELMGEGAFANHKGFTAFLMLKSRQIGRAHV